MELFHFIFHTLKKGFYYNNWHRCPYEDKLVSKASLMLCKISLIHSIKFIDSLLSVMKFNGNLTYYIASNTVILGYLNFFILHCFRFLLS